MTTITARRRTYRRAAKHRLKGLPLVVGVLIGLTAAALLRPLFIPDPKPGSDIERDWWSLDFPMEGNRYRLLFHLQEGRLYRLKFEQADEKRVFPVCEYFQEISRETAQQYDPTTGLYVRDVGNRRDFRVLSETLVQYARTINGGLPALRSRDRAVVVVLARRALRSCLAPIGAREPMT